MTYYETYQNALNALGYPNAEIKSQGIWGGSRAYTFDDQESKTHITLFKNEHGWRFGGSKKYYGRTGFGTAGFNIKK